jgi:ABC-2 type transport system permease protein
MLHLYRTMLLAAIQSAVQYRVQMLLWLLGNIIRPLIFLAAWVAVANARGTAIGGFGVGDFAAYYVALTLVAQLTQCWNAWEFEQEVRTGRLSPKLLRPLHPLHYSIVDNLNWKLFTLPALLPVLGFLAWSFGAHFTTQPWSVALFFVSVFFAAALRFLAGWILAALAFWTTRVTAIASLWESVSFIFDGQIAPLTLMPGLLGSIVYLLPFGYMLGVPADILRGGVSFDRAIVLMGGQAMWLAVAFVGFQIVWRAGLRQYSAVGA